MNAAQIARFLKQVGKGSEMAGVVNIYQTGRIVGAGQAALVIGAGYGIYRLGKWGYKKCRQYLEGNGYIAIAGEAH